MGCPWIRFGACPRPVGPEVIEHLVHLTVFGAPFGALSGAWFGHGENKGGGGRMTPRDDGVRTIINVEWPMLGARRAIRPATSADGEAMWQ